MENDLLKFKSGSDIRGTAAEGAHGHRQKDPQPQAGRRCLCGGIPVLQPQEHQDCGGVQEISGQRGQGADHR